MYPHRWFKCPGSRNGRAVINYDRLFLMNYFHDYEGLQAWSIKFFLDTRTQFIL